MIRANKLERRVSSPLCLEVCFTSLVIVSTFVDAQDPWDDLKLIIGI
jgi:hypothetical protein